MVPPTPITIPLVLKSISFLFGPEIGGDPDYYITLHIWEDSGDVDPSPLMYMNDFLVIGTDDTLHVIDFTGENIPVDGPIRVGIEFQHDGLPSVATDTDGMIPNRNLLYFMRRS